MTSLASDRQMRDNRLRDDGIETDSFPTVDVQAHARRSPCRPRRTTGAQVDVTLHGDLTLHGVTKTVDIPAKAQLNGSLIQVLGSLELPVLRLQRSTPRTSAASWRSRTTARSSSW